jgi:hypothetical protein
VSEEHGKKNPLLALLLVLLGGKKDASPELKEDAMKVMFAAATATKK